MQDGALNLSIKNNQAVTEIQELSEFQPALAQWHAFINVLSRYYHEQQEQQNANCELLFSIKENKLSALPKLSIALVKDDETLFKLHVSQENQKVLLVSKNQNGKHSIHVDSSDLQGIEVSLAQHLKELKEAIAKEPSKVEEIIEDFSANTSPVQKKNPKKVQNAFKSMLHNPFAKIAFSAGVYFLIAWYGRPIAAILGRELFDIFYRTAYGTPEYSWWNPISIINYNTYYVAPREHMGNLFYDHAEFIFSTTLGVGFGTWLAVKKISQNLFQWIRGRKQLPQPETKDLDMLCSNFQNMEIKQPLSLSEQIVTQSALILSKKNKLKKEDSHVEENIKAIPMMKC